EKQGVIAAAWIRSYLTGSREPQLVGFTFDKGGKSRRDIQIVAVLKSPLNLRLLGLPRRGVKTAFHHRFFYRNRINRRRNRRYPGLAGRISMHRDLTTRGGKRGCRYRLRCRRSGRTIVLKSRLRSGKNTNDNSQAVALLVIIHQLANPGKKLFRNPIADKPIGRQKAQFVRASRFIDLQRSDPGIELLLRQFPL